MRTDIAKIALRRDIEQVLLNKGLNPSPFELGIVVDNLSAQAVQKVQIGMTAKRAVEALGVVRAKLLSESQRTYEQA